MDEEPDYVGQEITYINTKLRELEERQRLLKDRLLLIGKNLIEMREKNHGDMLEMKKDMEMIKQNLERLRSFLETASSEFSNFARKEDLEILSRQAKMFQPLDLLKNKKAEKTKE